MRMRPLLWSISAAALMLGAGCSTISGGSCHKHQPYQDAQSIPPLRVPLGLDGPDTSGALEIPQLNEPEAPPDPEGFCLDAPPAITAPPPPPSEVVVPDPAPRGRAAPQGAQGGSGEEPSRKRRRPPRRPR